MRRGAAVVLARGDASTSARLAAAATALCNSHGFVLDQPSRRRLDETLTAARSALGDRFEEAWRAAAELEPEARRRARARVTLDFAIVGVSGSPFVA